MRAYHMFLPPWCSLSPRCSRIRTCKVRNDKNAQLRLRAIVTGHSYRFGLYKFGFSSSAGTMNTTAAGTYDMLSSSASSGECSPLTEFYDGDLDSVYVSTDVTTQIAPTGCSS